MGELASNLPHPYTLGSDVASYGPFDCISSLEDLQVLVTLSTSSNSGLDCRGILWSLNRPRKRLRLSITARIADKRLLQDVLRGSMQESRTTYTFHFAGVPLPWMSSEVQTIELLIFMQQWSNSSPLRHQNEQNTPLGFDNSIHSATRLSRTIPMDHKPL